MTGLSRRNRLLVAALIAVGVATPLLGYWLLVGRAPQVPWYAAHRLVDDNAAVLVNIGVAPPSSARSLEGAAHWPLASILATRAPNDVPPELRGRKLLLICPSGYSSARAALHLQSVGVSDAFSVSGGLQEWITAIPAPGNPGESAALGRLMPDAQVPAFRASPLREQLAAVATFFGVKFCYTVISAALIVVLWRRKETDLSALRWALIFFFVGEACCGINVLVFGDHALLLEYLHSAGMVLTFAYTIYALLEGLDRRLVHYSDADRCAAVGLCGACIKHADVGCGLRRLFLLLVPGVALVAALPLFSPFRMEAYNTRILGALYTYHHPILEQVYELRYLPIAAMILLAACFIVLWRVERHPVPVAKILFCAAAGAMGFSYFRLLLVATFIDNQVWFGAWEETTELLYVGLIAGVLLIFKRALLGSPRASSAAA